MSKPKPPGTLHPIVETLRDARIDAGLSQRDVAWRFGTVQSAISDMESGVSVPLLTTVDKTAWLFGLVAVLVPTVDS